MAWGVSAAGGRACRLKRLRSHLISCHGAGQNGVSVQILDRVHLGSSAPWVRALFLRGTSARRTSAPFSACSPRRYFVKYLHTDPFWGERAVRTFSGMSLARCVAAAPLSGRSAPGVEDSEPLQITSELCGVSVAAHANVLACACAGGGAEQAGDMESLAQQVAFLAGEPAGKRDG